MFVCAFTYIFIAHSDNLTIFLTGVLPVFAANVKYISIDKVTIIGNFNT